MSAAPRRRMLARVAGALGALALGAQPARANKPDRPLRAVALAIAPYGAIDAEGRKSGLFVEAFELIARGSRRQIEVTVAPYARAIAMLRSGAADLMIATSNSTVAEAAEPMGMLWSAEIIVIARAGIRLDGQGDLRGRTVGTLRGSDYGAAFLDAREYRKHEITDQVQGMRLLLEGRIDASIGTRLAIFHAMRQLGVPRSRFGSSIAVQSREIHLHLGHHSADEALAKELRHVVQELRSSGRAEALMAKYLAGLPSG